MYCPRTGNLCNVTGCSLNYCMIAETVKDPPIQLPNQFWQKCPKCDGEDIVNNDLIGASTMPTRECPVCKGKKIISTLNGNPPE